MANVTSNYMRYFLLRKGMDFSSDTFKIALMASGFAYNPATHQQYADVSASELANGSGYSTGGATLGAATITEDDVNRNVTVSWPNPSWTASVGAIGPTPGAIIYNDTTAGKDIVGYIDFGSNYTQADGGTAALTGVSLVLD